MHSNVQRFSARLHRLWAICALTAANQQQTTKPNKSKFISLGSILYGFIVLKKKKKKHSFICALVDNDNNCFFFGFPICFCFVMSVFDADEQLPCCRWDYRKWPSSGDKSPSNMRQSIKRKKYLIPTFRLNLNVAFAPQRYVRTF